MRKVNHSYSDAALHRLTVHESLNMAGESSAIHREHQAKRNKKADKLAERVALLLPMGIGISLAFIAQAMVTVESLLHDGMHILENLAMGSCTAGKCSSETWLSAGFGFIGMRLAMILIAALLTAWEPFAAGSGMAAVKSNLNGADITGYLNGRTLFAKSIGITLVVSTALPLGKEGPMVHIGACVASVLSGFASRVHSDFRLPTSQRAWASLGAAAGIAAAFKSPLGGILYSFEEVSSSWSMLLTWRSFVCVVAVSCSARFFREVPYALCGEGASSLLGCKSFLAHDFVIGLDSNADHFKYKDAAIPLFVVLAAMGGAMGAAFNFTVRERLRVGTSSALRIVSMFSSHPSPHTLPVVHHIRYSAFLGGASAGSPATRKRISGEFDLPKPCFSRR